MTHGIRNCALGILALVVSLAAFTDGVSAQVTASPDIVNVPATRSASIPVTWQITNPNSTQIESINSPNALVVGTGLETPYLINTLLTHGPVQPGQTARIRETLVIPQSVLMRVLQAGARTLLVERTFQVEVSTGQFTTFGAEIEVTLTGGLGGEVQVSRIDLRFQNEAVQIIVPQYHPPEVRVDVSYTGTGLFRAVWELADPRVTAAGGTPIYQVLRQDRIRLGIGGFKRIKGPNLPAQLTGLHVVRFRVLDGPLAGQAPVVRYFVKAAEPDGEDWWKRYIRPHRDGEGMVRVPDEDEAVDEGLTEDPADEIPPGEEPEEEEEEPSGEIRVEAGSEDPGEDPGEDPSGQ